MPLIMPPQLGARRRSPAADNRERLCVLRDAHPWGRANNAMGVIRRYTEARRRITASGYVYGDADPSLTYQVSGLKNGDTAGAVLNGGSLSRVAGENVGVYGINHLATPVDRGVAVELDPLDPADLAHPTRATMHAIHQIARRFPALYVQGELSQQFPRRLMLCCIR